MRTITPMTRQAVLVGLLGVLLTTSSVVAGNHDKKTLRVAPEGVGLSVEDMASYADDIVVAWQEQVGDGRSFIRYSTDGGATFANRHRLGDAVDMFGELPEGSHVDPQVDVCRGDKGDVTVAVSTLVVGPNRREVELEYIPLDGGVAAKHRLANHSTRSQIPAQPDIACIGHRRLIGAYFDTSTDPAHLKVVIRRYDVCFVHCDPPLYYQFDLGPARPSAGLSVAATDDRAYVVWRRQGEVKLKAFSVADDRPATVTARPTVTIIANTDASSLMLAAAGRRVALAYQEDADARVRISGDSGRTFGPHRTYVDGPRPPSDAAGIPTSVDMRGSRILLGGAFFCCGTGPLQLTASSHLSTDGGAHWSSTSRSIHGIQIASFLSTGADARIATAWDQRFLRTDDFQPPLHQKLQFR